MELDSWQKEVLKTEGNIVLRSGRQVGKSTVIGIKAANYALDNLNKVIMVISKTERQANLLFTKILRSIVDTSPGMIRKGRDKLTRKLVNPTKQAINLKNGSVIHCLPAGDTGYGIMGFTIDLLIADEAAFIPEEVWNSVTPALAVTRGNIWLLSTPFLKEGYYYNCFKDPTFTSFHTTSEACPRRDDQFLAHKKATLTKAQYAQMYLGEFISDVKRFFSKELINKVCIGKKEDEITRKIKKLRESYFLGVDVARMDRDEFVMSVIRTNENAYKHVENIITKDVPLPDNARRIMGLNLDYDFEKEYIDSGGMGIAICDMLREDDDNRLKVVEINNSSRPIDDEGRTKKILKEDLYNNLKTLMETDKIELLDDDEVKASLESIYADWNKNTGRFVITGSYAHVTESLIRAAWCAKGKNLKLFAYWI